MAGAVLRFGEVGRIALLALVRQGLAGLAIGVAGLGTGLSRVIVGIREDDELSPLCYSH